MDKKIIQSALVLAEPDPFIRDETEAPKNIDLGMSRYLLTLASDVEKVSTTSGMPNEDAAMHFVRFYIGHFWRFAKTIYDFSPRFLSVLEQTEDAPVYADVLKRLPYRDFVMALPAGLGYDGMFVHVEFDESYGENDTDTLFLLCPFKSAGRAEDILLKIEMQWCLNGKMFLKSFCDARTALAEADMTGEGKAGDITVTTTPGRHGNLNDETAQADRQQMARCLRIAVSACYYLASRNAEIREVRIPKSERPLIPSSHGGKPKRVAVKAYRVGYALGKSFEQQLKEQSSASCQTTGPTGGHTVRPHVRRAHWHHYWTGAGRTTLEVRWIEPTLVLPGRNGETELPTIRKVHGPER